jgi:creatinine amidohydrolase
MFLERSTWPHVEEYLSRRDLVVLGFGSTENHGRHNPLGTDWMAPQRILELLDERRPDVLVGPTLKLGSADHFIDYPGTLSLGDELLYQVAKRICSQLRHYGVRHFVFVNGHGGNAKSLTRVGYELNDAGCQVALVNWWKLAGQLDPKWGGGHGGAQETSANLWIDPSAVDLDAVAPMDLVDDGGDTLKTLGFDSVEFEGLTPTLLRRARRYASNGWIGPDDPSEASAEWGRDMLTAMADWLADFVDAFAESPLPDPIER